MRRWGEPCAYLQLIRPHAFDPSPEPKVRNESPTLTPRWVRIGGLRVQIGTPRVTGIHCGTQSWEGRDQWIDGIPWTGGHISKVAEEFPELFHYTGGAGLFGILSSGALWATNVTYLNDVQEYRLFFESRLPKLLRRGAVRAHGEISPVEMLRRVGRPVSEAEFAERSVMDLLPVFTSGFAGLGQPYVCSFCAHTDPLKARHGLLSQWRGYGANGGYALVFDTARLEQLLRAEAKRWPGMPLLVGSVEYFDDPGEDEPKQPEQLVAEGKLVDAIVDLLARQGGSAAFEAMFQPLQELACTAKHWGFQEENEVRVVMSVPSAKLADAARSSLPVKPINTFLRGGTLVPYLSLFAELGESVGRLPLKRVIVGPDRDAVRRAQSTEILLRQCGYDVQVDISAIPFRGHG